MRNGIVYFFFITVLFSTEFRTIFQTDGKTYYAIVFSLNFSNENTEQTITMPELLHESSLYLSMQEAMYIRNRLEEILDDDEEPLEDELDSPEEPLRDTGDPVLLGNQ